MILCVDSEIILYILSLVDFNCSSEKGPQVKRTKSLSYIMQRLHTKGNTMLSVNIYNSSKFDKLT